MGGAVESRRAYGYEYMVDVGMVLKGMIPCPSGMRVGYRVWYRRG
jgi:hypothetical protein